MGCQLKGVVHTTEGKRLQSAATLNLRILTSTRASAKVSSYDLRMCLAEYLLTKRR